MADQALQAVGQAFQHHPVLGFLLLFGLPILFAYWRYALIPYRTGRLQDTLSPWHVVRPSVPGVLERYATWEWTLTDRLTPFGCWVIEELERQQRTLAGLADEAGMSFEGLVDCLTGSHDGDVNSSTLRTLAGLLGAGEHQIDRLLHAERAAVLETGRRQ